MRIYRSDDGNASFVSLERGEDLLDGLHGAVSELGYRAATLQVIGGLDEAVVGFFDPLTGEYVPTRTGHVEIAAGLGNVSIRNGQPFVHLHLTLSDRDGRCTGGHAMQGCRTFVAEAYLRRLEGEPPGRETVEGLGIKAWPGA
jgi:predicted DNA-binding protein with PD1-like motif